MFTKLKSLQVRKIWTGLGVLDLALVTIQQGSDIGAKPETIAAMLGIILAIGVPVFQKAMDQDTAVRDKQEAALTVGWRIFPAMLLLSDNVDRVIIDFDQVSSGTQYRNPSAFIIGLPRDIDDSWLEYRHFPNDLAKVINQGVGLAKLHSQMMLDAGDAVPVTEDFVLIYRRQLQEAGNCIHRACLGLANLLGEPLPARRAIPHA
ncbi:hypothetical protein [Dongia sp.]|uniref:hypothetical protein n=1 Tax=Dongia sp. TaxID=1977262 RepID=UPI0035B2CC0E